MKSTTHRPELIERHFSELRPRLWQSNVRITDDHVNCLRCLVRLDGALLSVILEVEDHIHERPGREQRFELWAHLSVGGHAMKRIPSWTELTWCKRYFLGHERKAIQVIPAKSQYVNENPFVLHLFSPLEEDPLPDFRHITPEGKLGI